ncbi:MAG TPA: hypothetical protein VEC57_14510 [Candidatus Limnocylindrales bacterium]|nr:hypothetical protein [Candidatus Limnocylindrales bacterium]
MAFKVVVSPTLRFRVEGTTTLENGEREDFDFWLVAERLATSSDTRALEESVAAIEKAGSRTPITDTLVPKMRAWAGPVGEAGEDVPFSPEALRNVLNMPGIAALAFNAYVAACGAKAKNSLR